MSHTRVEREYSYKEELKRIGKQIKQLADSLERLRQFTPNKYLGQLVQAKNNITDAGHVLPKVDDMPLEVKEQAIAKVYY